VLKILIVDDEAVVRIGLKSMIDWQAHGFTLVGEAKDGRHALQLFEEYHPDLIITDLKMPVLDGLELIQKVRKISASCRIIALSSYDDFNLVRQAMKLGAADYLLKLEVDPDQLIKTLDRFRDEIVQERNTEMWQAQIHQEIKTNLQTIQRAFLKEMLCSGEFVLDAFREGLNRFEIRLNPKHIYSLVLRVGYRNLVERTAQFTAVLSVCEEVMGGDNLVYCFQSQEAEFVMLVSPKQDAAGLDSIVQACEKLVNILEQYLGVTVTIGAGNRANGVGELPLVYVQARQAIQYRFCRECGPVILWKEIQELPAPCSSYSVLQYGPLLEKAFSNRQVGEVASCLDTILAEIAQLRLDPETACQTALELYAMICETLDRNQLSVGDVLKSSQLAYHELLLFTNLPEITQWLTRLQGDLITFIQTEENENYPWIVAEATRFIKEHYTEEEISLGEVAHSVGLTPSYLSTLFREHMGVSYSDYLTSLRIEKAKELLQGSSLRVYEISHKVGYPNHYYFNRLFKKNVGTTPLDFRKSNKSAT